MSQEDFLQKNLSSAVPRTPVPPKMQRPIATLISAGLATRATVMPDKEAPRRKITLNAIAYSRADFIVP